METLFKGRVLHDLAPEVWDEKCGEYVFAVNEDGSRKHADDCGGCKAMAALASLAAVVDRQQEALEAMRRYRERVEGLPEGTLSRSVPAVPQSGETQ